MRWIASWIVVLALGACASHAPTAVSAPAPRPAGVLAQVEASRDLDGAVIGPSDADATLIVVFASWCSHCRDELDVIGALRTSHPRLRVLGLNYQAHEEYAQRGSADAVRGFVAASAPWMRVVPADEVLFTALGRPPKVPTLYVFDRAGRLIETYDRRQRALPEAAELSVLLRRLGA